MCSHWPLCICILESYKLFLQGVDVVFFPLDPDMLLKESLRRASLAPTVSFLASGARSPRMSTSTSLSAYSTCSCGEAEVLSGTETCSCTCSCDSEDDDTTQQDDVEGESKLVMCKCILMIETIGKVIIGGVHII